jgi:peptidoglycan L-alanyl-D-glutamate endopeptidase CwlK
MASREIEHLRPEMQPLARKFVTRCAERRVDVLITCTWRSNAEQAELYASGRTKPGRILTKAMPGQSAHNKMDSVGNPAAEAFDAVPLLLGKPCWEDSRDPDNDWRNDFGWRVMGEVAAELGLDWYGLPTAPFQEGCHFQWRAS